MRNEPKRLSLHCNYETKIQINRKNSNTTKELKIKTTRKWKTKFYSKSSQTTKRSSSVENIKKQSLTRLRKKQICFYKLSVTDIAFI
nr:MAG TPA: hypothetical protein [Caudoviricetes sp.]